MVKFNPGSFRFRIAASYFAIGLIFACFVTASFIILKKLTSTQDKVVHLHSLTTAVHDLTNDISKSNVSLINFLAQERQEDRERWIEAFNEIKRSASEFDSLVKMDDAAFAKKIGGNIDRLLQEQEKYERLYSETISGLENNMEAEFDFEEEAIDSDSASFDSDNASFDSPPQDAPSTIDATRALLKDYQSAAVPLLDRMFSDAAHFVATIENDKKQAALVTGESVKKLKRLILGVFGVLLFIFLMAYRKSSEGMNQSIKSARDPLRMLSAGDLPAKQDPKNDEIGAIIEEINILTQNLSKIKDFALEVGEGRYDSEINVFNNEGEIGKSLSEMRNSLKQIATDEKIRNWMNEGFARFAEILRRNGENVKQLSQNVVSETVGYLGANQAGIFILNNEKPEDVCLELTACYAYERQKYLQKEIKPGEGLVGQCYLEKQSIYLTETPDKYIKITSGLGGARPRNLFIAPLKFKDEVFGVIEIASFKKLESHEKEFIEKTAESIASAISSVQTKEHTNMLLEESQMAAEQLKAQEEEMRQNLEELAATQEEMHRNQKSIIENEQKTRLIYLNAFDAIITLNAMGQIDLFNPAAEKIFGYAAEETKGKSIGILLPDEYAGHHERLFRDEAAGVSKVIGLSRIVAARRKNGENFKIQLKVEEGMVGSDKIYLAFISELTDHPTARPEAEQKCIEMCNDLATEETVLFDRLSKNQDKLKKRIEEEDFLLRKSSKKRK